MVFKVDKRPRQWDIPEENEYEEDFSEPGSSSRKSNRSVIERKPSDDVFDEKDKTHDSKSQTLLSEPGATNLLSKGYIHIL